MKEVLLPEHPIFSSFFTDFVQTHTCNVPVDNLTWTISGSAMNVVIAGSILITSV